MLWAQETLDQNVIGRRAAPVSTPLLAGPVAPLSTLRSLCLRAQDMWASGLSSRPPEQQRSAASDTVQQQRLREWIMRELKALLRHDVSPGANQPPPQPFSFPVCFSYPSVVIMVLGYPGCL